MTGRDDEAERGQAKPCLTTMKGLQHGYDRFYVCL